MRRLRTRGLSEKLIDYSGERIELIRGRVMAEVGIANSLILLSRGVNQAARKRCFVGAEEARGGEICCGFAYSWCVHVLTRRENIYLGWSLLFLAVTKASNSRLCCFHANKFVTPAALIIAQIEKKALGKFIFYSPTLE